MEKKSRNSAGIAINTKKIISTNSMDHHTKNQLIHELLDGITLNDLKKFVELKKKMYSSKGKSVEKSAEDNIILPPKDFQDKHIPGKRVKKPIPTPRKSVKQMVQDYENNIIQPPLEFRDEYKPIPLKRTIIEKTAKALKGYTSSYIISKNMKQTHYFSFKIQD